MTRLPCFAGLLVLAAAAVSGRLVGSAVPEPTSAGQEAAGPAAAPRFEPVQPDLFAAAGGQPNAWADMDNDGDLDLFVGFQLGKPNRLYRNDGGTFVDVAAEAGVADLTDTRAAAWGDFDADGYVDLYIGFTRKSDTPNKLYRNNGPGRPFTDAAGPMGVDAKGETRQPSWIDYDNDGDLDLFVAFRDAPNMLFRNDGDRFVSVGQALGLDDGRRTVGAVWFDFDQDGDLDVFVANQNGDLNGLFRNDRTRFVDVAPWLTNRVPPPGLALVAVYYVALLAVLVTRRAASQPPGATVRVSPTTTWTATSTCSWRATGRTSSIGTTATGSSRRSRLKWACRAVTARRRLAGATTTTTAGRTCTSPRTSTR